MAANFAYVNGAQYDNNNSSTSIPISALNVTSGNLLVVGLRWEGGGATDTATATLADTAGNTYTAIDHQSTGSGEGHRIALFCCLDAIGHASNAITATISASRTYRQAYVAQYSYDGEIALGDTGNGVSGSNTTTVTSSPALAAAAGDLVVGWNSQYNGVYLFTPDGEYTARDTLALAAFFDALPSGAFSDAPGGTYSSVGDSYNLLTAVFEAVASSTLPTGRADETDTALGLTRRKAKAAQLARETDTALALTAAHARATGLASETDSALALAKLKAKATGLASETETALALVRVKAKPVGLATETDNALAVSAVKTRSTGRADETDTALALGEPAGVGLATETDSALSLARVKAKAVEVATTTETALALTARKIRLCGTAAETDTALGLAAQKIRACGRADESDTALARPPLGVIVRPVGLAIETDEALALEPAQREEEAATGGWARYFRAEQEALRRTRFRALDEEADETREREALAETLETALIADGTATQGDVDRLRLDQIAALYTDRTLLDRRAQRALAYAERSRTELATRLALRELQRQQEDEELAVLLVLAID